MVLGLIVMVILVFVDVRVWVNVLLEICSLLVLLLIMIVGGKLVRFFGFVMLGMV